MKKTVKLVISGPFACFTRPECKADKMSYEALTPSAARNILQAIYWKPAMDFMIKEIHVLKPVHFFSLKFNEINTKMPIENIQEARDQTTNLVLRDVSYGIVADIVSHDADPRADILKHYEMFTRRAKKSQSFSNPYLGLREFAAEWELVDEIPPTSIPEGEATKPLGPMLLDLKYIPDKKGKVIPKRLGKELNTDMKRCRVEGVFFTAVMNQGVIRVPSPEDQTH